MSSLTNGSDEYYRLKDTIKAVYEEEEGTDREQKVKKLRGQILSTYGDDEEAKWIIDHDLKYL